MLLRFFIFFLVLFSIQITVKGQGRNTENFNKNWKFNLGDVSGAETPEFKDGAWRVLNLPHDWSIEGKFDKDNPATPGGGALPGGIGWYRKTFSVPQSSKTKQVFVEFDGVYKNSEVWINGHYLGKRSNGYIAFSYELTPYLNFGKQNTIAVKVDNSKQPNSRWYSGSGIYRAVKLLTVNKTHVAAWGTFITTPKASQQLATVSVEINVINPQNNSIVLKTIVKNQNGTVVAQQQQILKIAGNQKLKQTLQVNNPKLWSDESPTLYTAESQLWKGNQLLDVYTTSFGIRSFEFSAEKGFFLNGKNTQIKGVCLHHDFGALGTAFNKSAAIRQLTLLKEMGCNGIRTSHNPPASEFLNLCDSLGFIVMDEAFDMWAKKKSDFDYHLDWEKWHKKDLENQILRDRNHASVFVWSTGNEIQEQWGSGADTTGRVIARELTAIVKSLDPTRPITIANNDINLYNNLIKSGAMDIIGYNYNHDKWQDFAKTYPGKKLIVTESTSALQTRGHYDMPSDSIRIWPTAWDKPLLTGNNDFTCSAYDNCRTPWGSTHEATLKAFNKNPQVSGIFVWTGFDYLGEPTPYPWPARSSYFGIIDLAGFPKDSYYLYKSEWTDKPVLHVFPHWNWQAGQTIDVWAYYSQADEVELFLNDKSLGKKSKQGDDMHVMWRVNYQPGTLKAISRKNGKIILEKEIKTAGKPAKIVLETNKTIINADEKDLAFITASVLDANGNVVPDASNEITFSVEGEGEIVATDNGDPTSHESFQNKTRKAFNGLALAVVKSGKKSGEITIKATVGGLEGDEISIGTK
ncbi:MAG TPA: beta-galactosidase GalB [Pelobium sp.]|nr:beta-galactosidase GalB [Pelobium sp.]